jgi:hypothetical protein
MADGYDFKGVATQYGIKCADGRTLMPGAFKGCNGKKVPLVWNHGHKNVENVLGHAVLEEVGNQVIAHCKLNNSPKAQHARFALQNEDLAALSIYANDLQGGRNVSHGTIREVSLVLAGANPGALIDTASIAHSMGMEYDFDDDEITEAYIYHNVEGTIESEEAEDPIQEEETETPELAHSSEEKEEDDKMADKKDPTAKEVFDSMNEDQKTLLYAMVAEAAGTEEEEDDMKHNVFDSEYAVADGPVISMADRKQILADIKRYGTLTESIKHHMEDPNGALAHAITPANYPENEDGSTQTYGIANIDWLFPDVKNFTSGAPEFIMRDQTWANKLLSAVHHTPFSRVKTMFADITADEARAKGYIKGNLKYEEVFTLLKRKIDPQTIYKKQKFDRDDIVDITDFDVVAWVKQEMRGMLNEEIARAILVGDGRSAAYEDKISEDHIKPVYNDSELFTIVVRLPYVASESEDARAKRVIRAAIKARKDYKGSGNPTMYTTADVKTNMLLLEDGNGYSLYKTENELATKCRVKEIEEVEILEGVNRSVTVESTTTVYDLAAIIFNPTDYNVGTDRGGEINTFEQFDIDYNQQKYLMETRISGALVRPKSAIVIEIARS